MKVKYNDNNIEVNCPILKSSEITAGIFYKLFNSIIEDYRYEKPGSDEPARIIYNPDRGVLITPFWSSEDQYTADYEKGSSILSGWITKEIDIISFISNRIIKFR